MIAMKLKSIHGGTHYRISDADAGKLARATGVKLPDWGREVRVGMPSGKLAWLRRETYPARLYTDAPKRGWVWIVWDSQPLTTNGRGGALSQRAADELKLFIDNDGDMYRQQTSYIHKALEKRLAKGDFDAAKAVVAFKHLADAGAQKYWRQFGSSDAAPGYDWSSAFSPATRNQVATEMAQEFISEHRIQHPTKNGRYTRPLPPGYTVYEQRGRLGEDPRYRWNWKTADGDVGVGYRTERLARDAAVASQEYLKRINAHLATLRGHKSVPNRKRTSRRNASKLIRFPEGVMTEAERTSRRNGRWKVWTGPTQVRKVADAYRAFPGVTDVLEGTEHVHFTYDDDPKNLTMVGVPSLVRAYAIGTSSTGIKAVRNGRRRTSRRAKKRTSRR